MDEGEDTGVPQRGEAGGRRAEERCAAYSAEEHGFPEADHRARWRARRGHTIVRVPSLSSLSAGRLHLVGLSKAREESATGGVWCVAASMTEQSIDFLGQ